MAADTTQGVRKGSIYAYRFPGGKTNTPLFIEGWAPGTIFRTNDFSRERERGQAGMTPRWIGPFRTEDGKLVKVRPASCGTGCYCAAEYKEVK